MQVILDDLPQFDGGLLGRVCLDPSTVRYITERAMMFEELVEGLRPFADVADAIAQDHPGWDHDDFIVVALNMHGVSIELSNRNFRRARTLLTRAQSLNGGKQ